MNRPVLEMRAIGKAFGPVRALDNVSLALRPGEIRGLVGENGAGKSTLMKILSGAVVADSGAVVVDGADMTGATPAALIAAGIAVIYQEFSQAPHLSVAENIFLGRLPTRFGVVDMRALRAGARAALERLGTASTSTPASATCRWRSGRSSRSRGRWRATPASSCSTNRPPCSAAPRPRPCAR